MWDVVLLKIDPDNITLSGFMSHNIKVATNPKYTREVKGCLEDIISKEKGRFTINDKDPTGIAERSPEQKDRYAKFGQIVDSLEKAVEGKEGIQHVVEPKHCAVLIEIQGRPRPVFIGEVSRDPTEIKLEEKAILEHLHLSKEGFMDLAKRG